jgi:serine/threonine-protein kinase
MAAATFGKYTTIRLLGAGGMGSVYLSRDPLLDRAVAIKVILPQLTRQPGFYERFHREARLVASMRHPHIVQVFDFAIERGDPTTDADDQPFMVMEYLDGGSLKDRLAQLRARGEIMPLAETARIISAVASALDYAHARGMIHRDVKPANILFTSQGEPVLTDFGVARIVGEAAQAGHIGSSGVVVGTPAYMSPEQAAGGMADARSDVYALGVVLYEMVCGRAPFRADSPAAALSQQMGDAPLSPTRLNPNLPAAVPAVILKSLAKQPDERFAAAGELAAALKDAIAAPDASLDAPTVVDAPSPTPAKPVAQTQPAAGAARSGWLGSAAALVEAVSPLVGQGAAKTERLPQGRLRQAIAIISFISIVLAAVDFLFRTVDRASQQFARLTGVLPYLVAPVFIGAFALAVYGALRARTRLNRRLAIATAVGLGAIGLAWGAWTLYERSRPPAGPIALVADFERRCRDCPDVNYGDRIREILVTQMRRFKLSNIEIRRAFQPFVDDAAARAQGAANKAALVIWGWYDAKGIQPRIELLRAPANPSAAHGTNRLILPEELPFSDFAEDDSDKEGAHLVLVAMGLARLAEADYAEALTFFNAALQAVDNAPGSALPNAGIAHLFKSLTLSLMGEPSDKVIGELEQSVTLKPGWPDAHYLLALAYSNGCTPDGGQGFAPAVRESEAALRLREDANTYWVRGTAHKGLRQWGDAAESFERSLRLQEDAQTRADLAEAYRMLNRPADAERVLAAVAPATAPPTEDGVAAFSDAGDALYYTGRYADASLEYQRAISRAIELQRSDDEVGRLRTYLAFTHLEMGMTDAAAAELEQAERLTRPGRFNYTVLAQTYRDLGRTADATRTYRAALDVKPCDYEARLGLADQYAQQKQFDLALAEYERARVADPDNGVTLARMAEVYVQQDRFDAATLALEEAARLFEAQVRLEPGHPKPASDLGKAYFLLGDMPQAVRALEAAATLSPADPQLRYLLGLAHAQNGDAPSARAAFEVVVDDPNAGDAIRQDAQKALEGLR